MMLKYNDFRDSDGRATQRVKAASSINTEE
jgi:hypothetical protein